MKARNPVRGVRTFAILGVGVLCLLLYRYWFGESGWFAVRELAEDLAAQDQIVAALAERNRLLTAEVMALKQVPHGPPRASRPDQHANAGLAAIEAMARTDLGMVAEGETFYLIVDAAEDGR